MTWFSNVGQATADNTIMTNLTRYIRESNTSDESLSSKLNLRNVYTLF